MLETKKNKGMHEGHSPDWAKEYTVLREWSVDHEDSAGT